MGIRTWKTCLLAALALALSSLAPGRAAAQEHTLKIATLAPEGSSWMRLFSEWGRQLNEHSGGRLRIKFYAGGIAGDERDVVRKIRLGQMSGAAVTSIGLGLIQSEVRVLELPLLLEGYD